MFKSIVELGKLVLMQPKQLGLTFLANSNVNSLSSLQSYFSQTTNSTLYWNDSCLYYLIPSYDKISKVIAIKINEKGEFDGIDVSDFSLDHLPKYMHADAIGSTNPPVWSPSYIVDSEFISSLKKAILFLKQSKDSMLIEINKSSTGKENDSSPKINKTIVTKFGNHIINIFQNNPSIFQTQNLPFIQIFTKLSEEYKLLENYKNQQKKGKKKQNDTNMITDIIIIFEELKEKLTPVFETIYNNMISSQDDTFQKKKESKNQTESQQFLLTFKFKKNNQYCFPGEITEIRDLIIQSFNQKITSNRKGVCSFCCQTKPLIANPSFNKGWQFFTTNNENYIINNFDIDSVDKQLPICIDCYHLFLVGSTYIKQKLTFPFKNPISYYVIPSFLNDNSCKQLGILNLANHLKTFDYHKNLINEQEYSNEYFLYKLQEEQDILFLDFLFNEQGGASSQVIIHLHIPDIFPSRLQELFKIKNTIETMFTYTSENNSKNKVPKNNPYFFTYSKIYNFSFYTSSNNKEISLDTKTFYTILHNTFKQIPISQEVIYLYFMQKINKTFSHSKIKQEDSKTKQEDFKTKQKDIFNITMDAFASYLFILLSTNGGFSMQNTTQRLESAENIEQFFESSSLDTATKKGLFLTGVLIGRVLFAQNQDKGSMPFLNKLKGMKMSVEDFHSVLGEAMIKLEEYTSQYPWLKIYKPLYLYISKYLTQATDLDTIHDNELNFFIALGIGQGIFYNSPFLNAYHKQHKKKEEEKITENGNEENDFDEEVDEE